MTGLARSLGLTLAVLYGLGVTIGAGIYVLVGLAAGRAGIHAPQAFLMAALVMGFSAATFAELGTRMPVSASEAGYVEAAFRRQRVALAVGLLRVVTLAISAATIAVGAAGYVSVFLPLPKPVLVSGIVLLLGAVATRATLQAVSVAGLMTITEVAGLVNIIARVLYGLAGRGQLTKGLARVDPGTLLIVAIVNLALIVIEARETRPPIGGVLAQTAAELPVALMPCRTAGFAPPFRSIQSKCAEAETRH